MNETFNILFTSAGRRVRRSAFSARHWMPSDSRQACRGGRSRDA